MGKYVFVALVFLSIFLTFFFAIGWKDNVPMHRPIFSSSRFIYDYAHLVSPEGKARLEKFLEHLWRDYDIELIAITTPSLGNYTISEWANMIFENWHVGKNTRGEKGILFVVAPYEKKVRLEIGRGLEGVFTDAFVGYIEREQMKPFFEEARVGVGVEATLELIVSRIEKFIKEGRYNPTEGRKQEGGFASSGAGAQKNVDIGSVHRQKKDVVTEDLKEYFSAQPTPQLTLERYLEACSRHIKDPNLGIYTEETKEFFRNWTVTNAQMDNMRMYEGVPFKLMIEGDYAVIFYPDKDWTYSPFFLKKGPAGWQLDFATMSKVIRFNQNNYWFFVSFDHPYMFAFRKYMIDENGFVWFKYRKR